MKEQEKFIRNLSALLEEKGITQRELAEKIEVTEVTISRYLSGERSPRIEIVSKMAEYFDVSVDYLLGVSDVRNSSSLQNEIDFHVGLSKSEESTLTDEEKDEIRNFAKFVMSKRK